MKSWYWKILLAFLLLVGVIFNVIWGNYGYAISLLLLIALPILLLFKHEFVIMALYHIRQQNLEKANFFLQKIKNPDQAFPIKKEVAYYYYLLGLTQMQQKKLQMAELNIRKALDLGLASSTDRAVAKLQIAALFAGKRQIQPAQNYLKQAKKEDKKGILAEQIDMLERQLKTPQMMMKPR